MNQDITVRKAIHEMVWLGLVRVEDSDIITPLIARVYGIGFDTGRISHIQRRPVIQLSLTGKKLEVFDSIKVASNKTGTFTRDIAKVANGKRKTANGFKWRFLDHYESTRII